MTRKTQEKASRDEAGETVLVPSAVNDNQLSYMIFLVAKSHRALAGEFLRPLGIYPGQELLLMHLWDRDGQTQTELIARLGLDASTVTKMVQRLETQGHLVRAKSDTDRRAVIVRLTPSGRKLREPVESMWASLNKETVTHLNRGEQKQLLELLQKVYSAISNMGGS